MDPELFEAVIRLGFPILLLLLAYGVGGAIERAHFRSIRRRERRSRRMPVTNFRAPPASWQITDSAFVSGSVVISVDYFKRFLAGLRGLLGGRLKTYESLLDRGRREAVLRMKEAAFDAGYRAVINVRIDTSRLASSTRDGKGTAGVEILAFGTALRLAQDP